MDNLLRFKQAWTIAKIELSRAFFSKRAFWVYGLALLPFIIFVSHSFYIKIQQDRFMRRGLIKPALLETIRNGDTPDDVLQRLGKAADDRKWEGHRQVRREGEAKGITTHKIDPELEARFVRMNIIIPTYKGERTAKIYELEVYGAGSAANLALRKPATGSAPCSAAEGPEKAFNGSVANGREDRWCSHGWNKFLQVDLGQVFKINRVVVSHASAGGESEDLDTQLFNIQASQDGKIFVTAVNMAGARSADEITSNRSLHYYDGSREVWLQFKDNKLVSQKFNFLQNFEEDRKAFAVVFQMFYLRLAIFFGCLGIYMNLFRGEMLDKTLHFWFLTPVRREVLLAGKYGAGLIASSIIFTGGAMLCYAALIWPHNPAEVQAYWQSAGVSHCFWYAVAAILGCIGYGSVFLAAGLLLRNPIIPAVVLLGWESINGFLPAILQKMSVLYYLQSLCPVPMPTDNDMPALLQLLLSPAAPASHIGAVAGLLTVTALVLGVACIAVRRMEISYGAE